MQQAKYSLKLEILPIGFRKVCFDSPNSLASSSSVTTCQCDKSRSELVMNFGKLFPLKRKVKRVAGEHILSWWQRRSPLHQ